MPRTLDCPGILLQSHHRLLLTYACRSLRNTNYESLEQAVIDVRRQVSVSTLHVRQRIAGTWLCIPFDMRLPLPRPSVGYLGVRRLVTSAQADASALANYLEVKSTAPISANLKRDLYFHPSFFDEHEQSLLLRSSLKKLQSVEPRRRRRRQALEIGPVLPLSQDSSSSVCDLFADDEHYTFEEVRIFNCILKHAKCSHFN